jgi:hypothetical protein
MSAECKTAQLRILCVLFYFTLRRRLMLVAPWILVVDRSSVFSILVRDTCDKVGTVEHNIHGGDSNGLGAREQSPDPEAGYSYIVTEPVRHGTGICFLGCCL